MPILFLVFKLWLSANFPVLFPLCGSLNRGLPAASWTFWAYYHIRALDLLFSEPEMLFDEIASPLASSKSLLRFLLYSEGFPTHPI